MLVELAPCEDETSQRIADIVETIEREYDAMALILIGGVYYYTGQAFEMGEITGSGHRSRAVVGFDLVYAAGNLKLKLHDWGVDLAAWCNYKYLNGGPGAVGGAFVHERHADCPDIPRLAGWWGHEKATRFLMGPDFHPIAGAEGWQVSNPPILQMAALQASLEIFDEAGMGALRAKSKKLTGYLEFLVDRIANERVSVITPRDKAARGCQLSIRVRDADKSLLRRSAIMEFADWREPDVIRVAPVPLYNTYEDVYRFSEIFKAALA